MKQPDAEALNARAWPYPITEGQLTEILRNPALRLIDPQIANAIPRVPPVRLGELCINANFLRKLADAQRGVWAGSESEAETIRQAFNKLTGMLAKPLQAANNWVEQNPEGYNRKGITGDILRVEALIDELKYLGVNHLFKMPWHEDLFSSRHFEGLSEDCLVFTAALYENLDRAARVCSGLEPQPQTFKYEIGPRARFLYAMHLYCGFKPKSVRSVGKRLQRAIEKKP